MTKPQHRRHSAWRLVPVLSLLLAAALAGCAALPQRAADDEAAIRALLARQVEDWNAGDVEGFLRGYLQAPETRFASGASVGRGWDAALARYRARYTQPGAMGQLAFGELEVESLGRNHALAFGRWRLEADGRVRHGLFTLVLARTVDGWKIARDHTSSGVPAGAGPAGREPAGSHTGRRGG